MEDDYRYSHTRPGKGEQYHEKFRSKPRRAMIWELEKHFLDDIVLTWFPSGRIWHLDFACGTGRILAFLQERTESSLGVDVSKDMLGVARKEVNQAEIIQADLTREDVLGDTKFNLITAFRFFPNAQPQLRAEAMHVLVKHLADSGCIVFNNHLTSSSLWHRFRKPLRQGMSQLEMKDLVLSNGLRVIKVYHAGVLPISEDSRFLAGRVLPAAEKIASRFRIFRTCADNLIYVCTHARSM